MSTQKKQKTSPAILIYFSAICTLASFALPEYAEQAPEVLAAILEALAASASGIGALAAILAAFARYLGVDQPCPDPLCRRDPATLDCVKGRHCND